MTVETVMSCEKVGKSSVLARLLAKLTYLISIQQAKCNKPQTSCSVLVT